MQFEELGTVLNKMKQNYDGRIKILHKNMRKSAGQGKENYCVM